MGLDRTGTQVTAFDVANRELRAELDELEERTRRRDILVDDEAVFEFYDRRIPADVASRAPSRPGGRRPGSRRRTCSP